MTGSLQVKNGKYYMVLNSTENGKRKQKWISTGLPEKGNKRKAEQMLREKLTEEEKRNPVVCSDMTVADCRASFRLRVASTVLPSELTATCTSFSTAGLTRPSSSAAL